jgi:FeS assembly SUF system protein
MRPVARDEREKAATPDRTIHSKSGDFQARDLRLRIVDALQTIYDPEIPVDVYQLGLIYSIDVHEDASVDIDMTLTSPACPVAGTLPPEIEERVMEVEGVDNCRIDIVWDPQWHPGMMTESARLELGFF